MKKKAQLGMGTTWFFVFVFVLVLVMIYLILSGLLSIFKGPGQMQIAQIDSENSILLKTFELEGKKYLIFEGLFMIKSIDRQGRPEEKKIYEVIQNEIAKYTKSRKSGGKGYCVIISAPTAYFFVKNEIKKDKFDPYDEESQLPNYREMEGFYEIKANLPEGDKKIGYYQGECFRWS